MYRIDDPSASPILPTPEAALTEGYWTEGNPGSGTQATLERASWFNMVQEELRAIPVAAGLTPSKTTYNQILTALKACFAPVVGSVRNLAMSVATASTSATLTADEIIVETALSGLPFKLSSFNKTINLATTGAGGTDTGTAPVSGYVALYAIYNPTTATAALLATNATSTLAPSVYGGANMPSGYTASALVSVLRTNASSQFVPFCQNDRLVSVATLNVLNSAASQAAYAPLSIAAAVPKNAKTWSGTGSACSTTTGSTINSLNLSADATNEIGSMVISNSAYTLNQGNFAPISNFPIMTPQTVYYKNLASGTPISILYVSGYTF
jgi:hypothetical protein